MKWIAALRGNSPVLYNLQSMDSPHFSIFDDSDDHESEQYFLRTGHLDGNTDAQASYSSICGLIELINGASAIEWGFESYERRGAIRFESLLYSESKPRALPTRENWIPYTGSLNSMPSNPFIGEPDYSGCSNPYTYKTTALIELCLDREDVFNLLRQISVGFDWRNLYCIWDTIRHYYDAEKDIASSLGLDRQTIKAFTGTANSFGVLGIEARHGVRDWKIPTNTISHQEAVNFINDVVNKYFKSSIDLRSLRTAWSNRDG